MICLNYYFQGIHVLFTDTSISSNKTMLQSNQIDLSRELFVNASNYTVISTIETFSIQQTALTCLVLQAK